MNIKNQLLQIQKIRKETQDAINSSKSVVNDYEVAQENYRLKMEAKKYAHLGNENFAKGVKKPAPFIVRRRKSHAAVPNINQAILNSYANKMINKIKP